MINNRLHKWDKVLFSSVTCHKCGVMARDLNLSLWEDRNINDAEIIEILNEVHPCITDEEAIVKEIIE